MRLSKIKARAVIGTLTKIASASVFSLRCVMWDHNQPLRGHGSSLELGVRGGALVYS